MPGDILTNRKALRDYFILEQFEAGLELHGTEVKSIRAGHVNFADSFARVEGTQIFLHGLSILPYEKASHTQHEPLRKRRLLMHRSEIDRLESESERKGLAIIALRLYWKGHRVKVAVGLGRGKQAHDKREGLKQRVEEREAAREVQRFNRS